MWKLPRWPRDLGLRCGGGLLFLLAASSALQGNWSRPKVLVDVDAGVDDAFALAVLLSADTFNEVDLVGITTVSGNTGAHNASLNVLKVLHTAGRLDIPVYQGAEYALDVTPAYDYFFGYDGFGDFDYPDAPNASLLQIPHAVEAMVRIVNNSPGEVVLMCLGPLTNVALAARLDPSFTSRLGQLVILGGAVTGMGNVKPGVEFNFFFDPLAAAIVLRAERKAPVLLVPWETVAIAAPIPLEWRRDELGTVPGPMMELLNQAEEAHLATLTDTWLCGDALAAALIVSPELVVAAERQHVAVEVYAGNLAGATIVDYAKSSGSEPNTVIVKLVDVEALKSLLLQYLRS